MHDSVSSNGTPGETPPLMTSSLCIPDSGAPFTAQLPLDDALRIGAEIADALSAAHEPGIVPGEPDCRHHVVGFRLR